GLALVTFASKRVNTDLWARDAAVVEEINTHHTNSKYLKDIALPAQLQARYDIAPLLGEDTQETLIILGVPVAAMDGICQQLQKLPFSTCVNTSVLWTCKGLQPDTGSLTHQLVTHHLSPHMKAGLGIGVLSGPSFAKEVARGLPVALTVATQHKPTAKRTTQALHGQHARI